MPVLRNACAGSSLGAGGAVLFQSALARLAARTAHRRRCLGGPCAALGGANGEQEVAVVGNVVEAVAVDEEGRRPVHAAAHAAAEVVADALRVDLAGHVGFE